MTLTVGVSRRFLLVTAALAVIVVRPPARAAQPQPPPTRPVPVRNDVPRRGGELLVLRHNELQHGAHEAFYRFNRDLYWPVRGEFQSVSKSSREHRGNDT
jgi:hypothetical protein